MLIDSFVISDDDNADDYDETISNGTISFDVDCLAGVESEAEGC